MAQSEPGWYPDPEDPSKERYWFGDTWSPSMTRPRPVAPPPLATPAAGWGRPPRPPGRQVGRVTRVVIGLFVGVIAIIVVVAVANNSDKVSNGSFLTAPTDATLPSPVTTATPAATTPRVTTARTAATVPAARTLLSVSGIGEKTTDPFTAPGPWHISYSYNCSNFGQAGNFAVEVNGGDGFTDRGPDTSGMSGHDTNYEPAGGTYSLQILSECSWHLAVTG